ncbi:MAG: endolytic transglycosylase MltG [Actinomycetaceae bacterium]|nr:endolytic transglycosylase MltG [Actinomycetaceae bacterium]
MSEQDPQSQSGAQNVRPSGLPSRRDIIRARQEAAAKSRMQRSAAPVRDGVPPRASSSPKTGADSSDGQLNASSTGDVPTPDSRREQGASGSGNATRPGVPTPVRSTTPAAPAAPSVEPQQGRAGESNIPTAANAREVPKPAGSAGGASPVLMDPLTTGVRSRRIEVERKRLRRKRRNAKIRSFFILLTVAAVLAGCAYISFKLLWKDGSVQVSDDYPGPGTGSVEFVINPSDTGAIIGANLVKAGVVKSEEAFLVAWNDNADATSIQPGTYQLKKQMSAVQAVAALLDETRRSSNAVTVIPGASVKDVTEKMKAFAKFSDEDVDAAVKDPAAIGLPAEANGSLEGWLAPGTYEIHVDEKPAQVLERMVKGTVTTLEELQVPREQWHTVLTKASILEMEVNIDRYLPQVARVIENRLANPAGETAGFLNMDSTVNYGVGRSGGIPTADDLEKDTPYNTYIHKGLPPTPIASPSREAVEATLKPADGDWLYFVTVDLDSGETKFAVTKDEHDANIVLLRQWCEAHKDKC